MLQYTTVFFSATALFPWEQTQPGTKMTDTGCYPQVPHAVTVSVAVAGMAHGMGSS